MQRKRIAVQYLCKPRTIDIRCIPKRKTAYLRLNCPKTPKTSGQYSWHCIQLVRHRAVSRMRQFFSCPHCSGSTPVLYFLDRLRIRCRHCCPLPRAITSLPSSTAQLRRSLEAGSFGLVAEHFRAGGRKALSAMLALEMAGLSPPRLVPHRCEGSWYRDNPDLFLMPGVTAPLRRLTDRPLLYAAGHLWVRP